MIQNNLCVLATFVRVQSCLMILIEDKQTLQIITNFIKLIAPSVAKNFLYFIRRKSFSFVGKSLMYCQHKCNNWNQKYQLSDRNFPPGYSFQCKLFIETVTSAITAMILIANQSAVF